MYSNPFKIENGLQSVQIKNHIKDDIKRDNQDEITFNQSEYQSFNSFGKYNSIDVDIKDTVLESNNAMNSNWSGL